MNHTRKIAATGAATISLITGAIALNGITNHASAGGAIHAKADIRDASGRSIGWAKLTEDAAGRVHVNVKVSGLASGAHGAHLHAVGNCDPAGGFAAAAGHYNPTSASHGPHPKADHADHHAGDLPNLVVDDESHGTLNTTTAHFALDATATKTLFDGDGSAIVVHVAADDFTSQPSGASGARIACGVIEPA